MPAQIVNTSGSYNKRIEIQQIYTLATRDAANVIDETDDSSWVNYAYRWAKVAPLVGRELDEAKKTAARASYEIRMRSDSETRAIGTAMRIVFGTRKLNIEFVADLDSASREMYLLCSEAAP
jgi:SPP1 family predicted phage head-tail adaptor